MIRWCLPCRWYQPQIAVGTENCKALLLTCYWFKSQGKAKNKVKFLDFRHVITTKSNVEMRRALPSLLLFLRFHHSIRSCDWFKKFYRLFSPQSNPLPFLRNISSSLCCKYSFFSETLRNSLSLSPLSVILFYPPDVISCMQLDDVSEYLILPSSKICMKKWSCYSLFSQFRESFSMHYLIAWVSPSRTFGMHLSIFTFYDSILWISQLLSLTSQFGSYLQSLPSPFLRILNVSSHLYSFSFTWMHV